jgi:two-component system response regulator FixJ
VSDHSAVAFVDDDEPVRDAARMYLGSIGYDVRCFDGGGAFLRAFDDGYKPDCLVSDVRMSGLSGLELLAELKRRRADCPVVLITGHGDVPMAVTAIKSGAWDFLEKPFDGGRLAEVIGGAVRQRAQRQSELEEVSVIRSRMSELSGRQRDVLRLIVDGNSNKEIAAELRISPRTVETYRAWVMNRMGAKNLAALVRMVSRVENID